MLLAELVKFVNSAIKIPMDVKYTATHHTRFLLKASGHDAYLENVNIRDKTPSADITHIYIKETETSRMHLSFLDRVETSKKKLKITRGIVILDYTYEPFYGKINSNSRYIHEYKPEEKCNGCFMFLCASILIGNRRIFLDSIPVPVLYSSEKLVERMLDRIQRMKIKIEILLLDRGFTKSSKILDIFNRRKIKYLGLFPKQENVKKILKSMKRTFLETKFMLRGIETKLVIIKDNTIDWTFVTNINRNLFRYIQIYKKRWNIENGFQVCDRANIDTKSVKEKIRYFFFLFTLVLYNLWKSMKIQIPFKRLVILLAESEYKFASLIMVS
ncbi:MAG: transposase [Bacteroidetes bacterium]|nr:transposase [Bacteroidota bacterium]